METLSLDRVSPCVVASFLTRDAPCLCLVSTFFSVFYFCVCVSVESWFLGGSRKQARSANTCNILVRDHCVVIDLRGSNNFNMSLNSRSPLLAMPVVGELIKIFLQRVVGTDYFNCVASALVLGNTCLIKGEAKLS